MKTKTPGIEQAIKKATSQVVLADQLGVSQQSVSLWKKQGWVPFKRASEIEHHYGVRRRTLVNPRLLDMTR